MGFLDGALAQPAAQAGKLGAFGAMADAAISLR
jgi:hypothetical protein